MQFECMQNAQNPLPRDHMSVTAGKLDSTAEERNHVSSSLDRVDVLKFKKMKPYKTKKKKKKAMEADRER